MAYEHPHHLHQRPRPPRPGTSFALVNGLTLGVHLVLACSAPDFMGERLWGASTVGMLALLLQASLLLWTAARYDRRKGGPAPHQQDVEQY
ncbi:hypothetical protein FBY35_6781 [Streptomyces sp. SLBN-118]|uniref:hypothetical protein n=1 Tax=Streptomyces sp. SLBN-118 TaxID=2768454 RepID=UPI00114E0931|nr:hypothetical protein [Streptomyces sp. SLBN-118]TQK45228.1 hypothetical protein FBY35_6781 [Streptomyces sp. SLBN-118]